MKDRIINLALSENNNKIPQFLLDDLRDELQRCNKYPGEMFSDVERIIREKNGLDSNYNVLIGNGLDEIILVLFMAIMHKKGKIICSSSTFNGYKYSANALGILWDEVPLNDFKVDSNEMCNRIDSQTSAVVICNPHNPCGTILSLSELSKIIDRANEYGALVIVDEAYIEYVTDEKYKNGIRNLFITNRNVIELHTLSKAFGLAGLRCGYALLYNGVIENVYDIIKALPFRVNRLACLAAQTCMNKQEFFYKQIEEIRRLKLKMYDILDKKNIKYIKSETNFLLIFFGEQTSKISKVLLEKYHIKIRECDEFDLKGYVRISIGTESEMNILTNAIDEIWWELKYA